MAHLQVGVIGLGSIATHRHLPEFAANPRAQIRAVCGRSRESANAIGAQFGAVVYTDYRKLLANPDVQAVSICLPNHLHAEVSIAALRAGKHVLCEKPMATSLVDAQAMIDAAKDSGKILMIAHNQRFLPAHVKAKQILHSGKLGAVLTFRTTFSHGGPERWSAQGNNTWFFHEDESRFGVLGDLGVHKIDLVRWLLEDEVRTVSAMVETLEKPASVDDNAVLILQMASGALGTVTTSWTHHPGRDNSTHLYCEHGVMHIADDPRYQVVIHHEDETVERIAASSVAAREAQSSGVIGEFVDAIFSQRESAIPGAEGMAALRVVLTAMESARTGVAMQVN